MKVNLNTRQMIVLLCLFEEEQNPVLTISTANYNDEPKKQLFEMGLLKIENDKYVLTPDGKKAAEIIVFGNDAATEEKMTLEQKIEGMKIGLGIAGIPVNDVTSELIILTYEGVMEKGDTFSIRDSSKIQASLNEKYGLSK